MGMILDQYHVIEYRGLKRKISRESGSMALCKPLVSHRFALPILNQRVKNPELFNGYSGGTVYALLMGHTSCRQTRQLKQFQWHPLIGDFTIPSL